MKPLNTMDLDELLALRRRVEGAINARVKDERQRLQESLQKLEEIVERPGSARRRQPSGRANGHSKGNGRGKRESLSPKFRNPTNPKETWAGRGLKPRWLVAALKGGKRKLSDFEIHRRH